MKYIRIWMGIALCVLAGSMLLACNWDESVSLSQPSDVAMDAEGNLYVADLNHTIGKVTPKGVVSIIAGKADEPGSADGEGTEARFNAPRSLAVDTQGNLYVVDGSTIRKITASGQVTTLAGTAGIIGSADGQGAEAEFSDPHDIAVDRYGNAYVADTYNLTIRKITANGQVTTIAGRAGEYGELGGLAADARFTWPRGIALDDSGNLYVSDASAIRKISAAGMVTRLAGDSWKQGHTNGAPRLARFDTPKGIVVDSAGTLYVADSGNRTVRKVSPTGRVAALAGFGGEEGDIDGQGRAARFSDPQGLAIDLAGNIILADVGNNSVRKITPTGSVTTLARGKAVVKKVQDDLTDELPDEIKN